MFLDCICHDNIKCKQFVQGCEKCYFHSLINNDTYPATVRQNSKVLNVSKKLCSFITTGTLLFFCRCLSSLIITEKSEMSSVPPNWEDVLKRDMDVIKTIMSVASLPCARNTVRAAASAMQREDVRLNHAKYESIKRGAWFAFENALRQMMEEAVVDIRERFFSDGRPPQE